MSGAGQQNLGTFREGHAHSFVGKCFGYPTHGSTLADPARGVVKLRSGLPLTHLRSSVPGNGAIIKPVSFDLAHQRMSQDIGGVCSTHHVAERGLSTRSVSSR